MKKSTGNMYPNVHTTSHVSGGGSCSFNCPYCFKNKFKGKKSRKKSRHKLKPSELRKDMGSAKTVFVASGSDICSPVITDDEIIQVLDHCAKYPGNTYMFQSKNPGRLVNQKFLTHPVMKHAMVGTTIETNRNLGRDIMGLAPATKHRAAAMAQISQSGIKTYVTLEPLMQFDLDELVAMVKSCNPALVYVGRNSLRRVHLPEPARWEVVELMKRLKEFTTVELKDNAYVWS